MILTEYVVREVYSLQFEKKNPSFTMILDVGKARNEKREFQQSLFQVFTHRPPFRPSCGKDKGQRTIIQETG